MPVIIKSENSETTSYALCDSGANCSAVRQDIIDQIQGEIFELPCKLTTFGSCENSNRNFTNLKILPLDRTFSLDIKNALVGDILTTERDKPPKNEDIQGQSYLNDVHFDELNDPKIGVILDARFAWTWVTGDTRMNTKNDPIGLNTNFGWTLIGPALDVPKTDNVAG